MYAKKETINSIYVLILKIALLPSNEYDLLGIIIMNWRFVIGNYNYKRIDDSS